jgi:hypothetical protein
MPQQEAQFIPVPAPFKELLDGEFCILAEDEERLAIGMTVRKSALRQDFQQRYQDLVEYLKAGPSGVSS